MAHFKLITFFIFFGCLFQAKAQKHPVFYGGFNAYRHTGFENNSFAQFSVGTQVYQLKFFAPEISYSIGGGSLSELSVFNKDGQNTYLAEGLLRQKFSYSVLSLNPKLKFGNEDAYITFSPKYHLGSYTGQAAYLEQSDDNHYLNFKEGEKAKIDASFWSFAVGFEGFTISSKYWFGISLEYTTTDANEVWDKMEFSSKNAYVQSTSTATIGLGLRFYYNPFASEKD